MVYWYTLSISEDGVSNTFQEEGIMSVSCWVLLRLEKSIKVPEWALNEVICGHFRKSAAVYYVQNFIRLW